MCAPSTSASAIKMMLAVARGVEVEGAAGAGADDLDDRGALGVLEHVGDGRLLHVEDLAADRQQRLELGVAGQLGGAERGVALDDEQLAAVDVVAAAVDQLGGKRGVLQGALAALVLLCWRAAMRALDAATTFSRTARTCCFCAALGAVERLLQLPADDLGDDPGGRRGAEDLLGLALELRLRQAHGDDRGEALEDVVLDDVVLGDLAAAWSRAAASLIDLEQRPVEAGDVGAALGRGDHVDERPGDRVVAGAPAQGDVDAELALDVGRGHVALLVQDGHGLGEVARGPGSRRTSQTGLSSPGSSQNSLIPPSKRNSSSTGSSPALVADRDGETGHEEGRLPHAVDDGVAGDRSVLEEDLTVGPEAHAGAGDALGDALGLAQPAARRLLGELGVRPRRRRSRRGRRAGSSSRACGRRGRPRRRAGRTGR